MIESVEDEDKEITSDPKGDVKIDDMGRLQGGREYIIRTGILPRHPSKLYMLTMDVARWLGYRRVFFLGSSCLLIV